MLVHRPQYDEAVARAKEFAEGLRVGTASDNADMGPLVSAQQLERVRTLIRKVRRRTGTRSS